MLDIGSGWLGDVDAFNQDLESWSRLVLILFWNHFRVLHRVQDNWRHPRILPARAGVAAQNKCPPCPNEKPGNHHGLLPLLRLSSPVCDQTPNLSSPQTSWISSLLFVPMEAWFGTSYFPGSAQLAPSTSPGVSHSSKPVFKTQIVS